MSQIFVREVTPGLSAASHIMSKLKEIGIHDVQLFYDKNIQPRGMWAVVQVRKRSSSILMPDSYAKGGIEPYIMWWCKTIDGHFRLPNDNDLTDIIKVATAAPKVWADPEKFADSIDEASAEKDRKHREKFRQKIHDIAPAMQKAIQKELT